MVKVKVKFLVTREIFDFQFAGGKLKELIEALRGKYSDNLKVKEYLDFYPKILINGVHYELLKNTETELKDGDTIVFLPMDFPIAGG